ncbi:NAD(P)/FAD-dependent oxidoreductase [Brachybacterium sacelli]
MLIVGGGPTGLLLAALLARRGGDVLVLERRTAPAEHSRAIGLHPPALAALRDVGLERAAVEAGAPIRCGRARSRGRELGEVRFARAWPGRPFVLALPQSRTEALLADRLAAVAPDALRRGWEVTGLRELGGGVEVTARRADGNGADEQPGDQATHATGNSTMAATVAATHEEAAVFRARVVVGADGARSTVRDLLGIDTTGVEHRDTYLMGDLADPDGAGEDRDAIIHLEPGGVVESFPLPGARRRWVVHSGRAGLPRRSPELLTALIQQRTGTRLDPTTTSMISPFTVRRRTARRLLTERCVLLGDAAHEVSPIGGQGITLGWLDVLDVAPLLQRAASDPRPLPEQAAWRRLARRWRRRTLVAGLLGHANTALGRPLPAPLAGLRTVAVGIALRTPLRHLMAWTYSMGWGLRI